MGTEKIIRPWNKPQKQARRTPQDPGFYQSREWFRIVKAFFGMVWDNAEKKYVRTKNLLCVMCTNGPKLATVCDHIIPKRAGGSDDEINLQPLCYNCHQIKTARDKIKYK